MKKCPLFYFKLVFFLVFIMTSTGGSYQKILAQESFTVPSTVMGTQFTAISTGTYRFTIKNGAYSCYNPPCNWSTAVFIYKNGPPVWNGPGVTDVHDHYYPGLSNWNYKVGDETFYSKNRMAEENSKGMYVDIPLEKGDYLIFIISDFKDYFFDNAGKINFDVDIVN